MEDENNSSINEIEYEIEKIIGKRIIKGEIEYKVKWLGYDESQSTWEPMENLINAKEAIKEYENYLEMINSFKKPIPRIKSEQSLNKNENEDKKNYNEKESKIKNGNNYSYSPKNDNEKLSNLKNNSSYNSLSIQSNNLITINNKSNKLEILEVIDICEINKILYGNVTIKENGKIKKNILMKTKEIADINPKKLIKFYETNIIFTE
jgi:hypothetical protein